MSYIVFNNDQDTQYKDISVSIRETQNGTGNAVEIMFPAGVKAVVNTSGFKMYSNEGKLFKDFSSYKTLYRENYLNMNDVDTEGYMLSNDESVWVDPEPTKPVVRFSITNGELDGKVEQTVEDYSELEIPVVNPHENYEFVAWSPEIPESGEVEKDITFVAEMVYVEPLESVKERKIAELNAIQQETIDNGTDVMLSDGTIQHFTATANDQTSLLGLLGMIQQGMTQIPWHCSDKEVGCQFYSVEDITSIVNGVYGWVTMHVTMFRDLRRYIMSMTSKEEVEAAYYGMPIPKEYQSEVLVSLFAQQAALNNSEE